jgi:hypothetical protein
LATTTDTRFKGQVIKRPYAVGSKSEQVAVCLVDAKGKSYRLRRLGGRPTGDEQLEQLVGKTIAGTGRRIAGNTVVLSEWTEVPAAKARKAKPDP